LKLDENPTELWRGRWLKSSVSPAFALAGWGAPTENFAFSCIGLLD
jgi:hypothetical protein